ncbi:hypothetical protein [Paenibacillus sedimenti]|uniref:Uncharacterized protein n=1 Tax=Paenibacillus sedimenti TaxID=2770274 RepID=A0A926QNF0_9BACL|nr:hypothetical protein [Paenibacillus sedimenti]MBD0384702.1 hypothetical protein [Paenibacillus sedimenti]
MNTKSGKSFLLFAAMIICVTFFIFQLLPKQEKPRHEPIINENYIKSKSFNISSISSDFKTSAKGTVFVKGVDRSPNHILIVATIEIDPEDWGGVAFYIPEKWSISKVTSSYPENKPYSNPVDYIATWTSNSKTESHWKAWIEVGRDRSYKITGGGVGTVVIDLIHDENEKHQPETFEFGIEVGSKEVDGRKEMGTDFIKIPISLIDNN